MSILKKLIISLMALSSVVAAATSQSVSAYQQQSPDSQQSPTITDPIRELNLSPQQREQIRSIRQQLQGERAAINQRLRQMNAALEEALDADNPDESVIEQRLRDVADAQAAAMRIRVLSEVRIRKVLTPEQVSTLRTLRQNARLLRRERQRENMEFRRPDRMDRRRSLGNPRNALDPLSPRRPNQQRARP